MKTYGFELVGKRIVTIVACVPIFPTAFFCNLGEAETVKKSPAVRKAKQTTKPQPKSDNTAKTNALTQAIFFKEKEKIYTLLKQGANVNGVDSQMRTPLMVALLAQSNGEDMLEILRMLRDAGAIISPNGMGGVINDFAITNAFETDNAVFIQTLGTVYGAKFYNEYRPNGNTPLMQAAILVAPEIAKALLDSGTGVNSSSKSLGETPLMLVGQNGPVSKMVIHASSLVSFGQKVPKEFATQLAQAQEKEKAFVRLLVERGANLNAQDAEGNTALIHVAERGRADLIQELLKQRANPNIKNKEGQTALVTVITKGEWAIQEVMDSTEKMLLAEGTLKIPITKPGQKTNSQRKADEMDVIAIRTLLEGGADPTIKDNAGKTALNYASSAGRNNIVQLLMGKATVPPQKKSPVK